jgi:choline kinase
MATARRWPRSRGEVLGEALFVLVTADHLFGEGGLGRLLVAGAPAVLIDPAPDRSAWAEGTRVRVVDQAVVAFGKHLEEPAIDCGAFLLPLEVFGRQRRAASEGDHSLAGAVTRLAQTRPLRAVDLPAGCWWQDVDTPRTRGRPGWRCAARSAKRPMGRSAGG